MFVILYSAYVLWVFNFTNFVNLELFVKLIQLKFEPLRCHVHGQHTSMNFFFNQFLQNSYLQTNLTHGIKGYTVWVVPKAFFYFLT